MVLLENSYDLNGNRTGLKDITGKETRYSYDALDRLETVVDNGKQVARYVYNPDGTIAKLIVGEDIVTEYGYDTDKNVISQKTYSGEDAVVINSYEYNSMGQMTTKKTISGLTQYTYDNLDRLKAVTSPNGAEEFTYDLAGNRLKRLWKDVYDGRSVVEEYQYDACNRLVVKNSQSNVAGTDETSRTLYSYDAQGNMVKSADSVTGEKHFTYDALNRLSEVTSHSDNLSGLDTGEATKTIQRNHYDAEGLRHEMEENGKLVEFIFDGDKVVAETDESKGYTRYIRGYEINQAVHSQFASKLFIVALSRYSAFYEYG